MKVDPEAFTKYAESSGSDLFLYSGQITNKGANELITSVLTREDRREHASLLLCTYGGNADAAYRIARFLQRLYAKLTLLITGPCKSAGTLIAAGFDELAFSFRGEIGPLDIQLAKPDEIAGTAYSSGLDALRAYDDLSVKYYESFEYYLLRTIGSSQGFITTKTAAEFACALGAGLIGPIAGQIDPYRLSEVGRAMNVAREYATRLDRGNQRMFAVARLVESYPSHGFVIDEQEAKDLFFNVRPLTADEYFIQVAIGSCAYWPASDTVDVRDLLEWAESQPVSPDQEAEGGADGEEARGGEAEASPESPSLPDAGVGKAQRRGAKRKKARSAKRRAPSKKPDPGKSGAEPPRPVARG